MSGWSTFKTTIFAALRVVPPERMLLATPSAPFINETGPDEYPPLESCSFDERSLDRFVPDPDPYLKIHPSSLYHSRIDCIVSSTAKIKQAEHCGRSWTPTLNHTGLLKAAYWLTRRNLRSFLKF